MMSEPPALVGGHNELLPMFLQITADLFSQTRARTVQRDAYDEGRLRDGELVLMTGVGAGLTWGSALLEWRERKAA